MKRITVSYFVLFNAFLECHSPRFLNKTEIAIQKKKRKSPGRNTYTPNSQN